MPEKVGPLDIGGPWEYLNLTGSSGLHRERQGYGRSSIDA